MGTQRPEISAAQPQLDAGQMLAQQGVPPEGEMDAGIEAIGGAVQTLGKFISAKVPEAMPILAQLIQALTQGGQAPQGAPPPAPGQQQPPQPAPAGPPPNQRLPEGQGPGVAPVLT